MWLFCGAVGIPVGRQRCRCGMAQSAACGGSVGTVFSVWEHPMCPARPHHAENALVNLVFINYWLCEMAHWLSSRALDLRSLGRGFDSHRVSCVATLGKLPLSLNCITWYRSKYSGVFRLRKWLQAGRKVMASYHWGWFKESPAGWLPVYWDQLRARRSVTSIGAFYLWLVLWVLL